MSTYLLSDEQQLAKIGIYIDSLKHTKPKQKQNYYLKIVQCLRECKNMNNQKFIDNYLNSIIYLCENKEFSPIQTILNIPIPLKPEFPEITVPFSEYLLIKGFNTKLIAACEKILTSFAQEDIDLLEIELLLIKGKSGIKDRKCSYELFQKIHTETEPNSLLYIESLYFLALAQFNLGNYKDSLANFEKNLNIIDNKLISDHSNKVYEIKADVLEGIARIAMINNKWSNSLFLYKQVENICKKYKIIPTKLIHCLWHQGVINRKIKKYDMALQYFQEAKEIAVKIHDERAIEWINHHTGYVYLNPGQYDLAEQLAQECLEKAKSEKRNGETGDFYEQLGLIKLAKKQINEAIEDLKQSLSFRGTVGNEHGKASSRKHLSVAYLAKGDYLQAVIEIKECIKIFYQMNVFGLSRIYRILYLFLEWTIGKKSSTS